MEPTDLTHEDWQMATHHYQQGDNASAEKICREILEELPTHLGATHLLGVICGRTGRLPEAIQTLQRAVQLEPSSAEIMSHLSYALAQAGAHARALHGFQRVRELSPGNIDAIGMIGSLSLQLGRYQEAADALMEAADLRPRAAEVQMLKGHALLRIGRLEDAESALRRSLELKADFTEAAVYLGECLSTQGKHKEAERHYREWLGKDPRFHGGLVRLLESTGRHTDAIEIAKESVATTSPAGEAVRLLAQEQARTGDSAGAVQSLQQSLPRLAHDTIDMASTMFDLARAQFSIGDTGGAMTTALQARAALAPQGRPKFARGKHYLKMLERLALWPSDAEMSQWAQPGEEPRVCAIVGVMGARADILFDALRGVGGIDLSDGKSTLIGMGGEIPGQQLGSEIYPQMISALDESALNEVRSTYLSQLGEPGDGVRVDAHEHNIEHLAALARIVPGFRAVVVTRDPSDALAEAMLEPTVADESALVLTSVADMATGILGQYRILDRASSIPGLELLVVDADELAANPERVITNVVEFTTREQPSEGTLTDAVARVRQPGRSRLPAGCGSNFATEFAPIRAMLDPIASMRLGKA